MKSSLWVNFYSWNDGKAAYWFLHCCWRFTANILDGIIERMESLRFKYARPASTWVFHFIACMNKYADHWFSHTYPLNELKKGVSQDSWSKLLKKTTYKTALWYQLTLGILSQCPTKDARDSYRKAKEKASEGDQF